jgi:hypothetical protein
MHKASNGAGTVRRLRKKKILIVNCYFPEMREPIKRINEVPNALAPVLLAGHFCPDACDIRLYNEVNSGFLEVFRPELLDWEPDMLVLTGLTAAFDRLLHLTAYARTQNPEIIVAAGGHGVRALPRYSQRFFDYACQGDVDEIVDVIEEALGSEYVASVTWNPVATVTFAAAFAALPELAVHTRSIRWIISKRNWMPSVNDRSFSSTTTSY